jgi:hypothetical protein
MISRRLAERDRILTALQELDFDHVLGKIPERIIPDAHGLDAARQMLRKLDAYGSEATESDVEASRPQSPPGGLTPGC